MLSTEEVIGGMVMYGLTEVRKVVENGQVPRATLEEVRDACQCSDFIDREYRLIIGLSINEMLKRMPK